VGHRDPDPSWIGLHCRPKEHLEARPTPALSHDGLPRLHGKDEELTGVQFRASPKTEWRCGNRATAVVALGESDAQSWREGKESKGGAVEDGGVLPFIWGPRGAACG
jgi:hypothetical protein